MKAENVFTEKYRPIYLKDIVGQDRIVSKLQGFVKTGNIPHMMFSGRAGTGKTTSVLALTRELYGDKWKRNHLELNASDKGGVNDIRKKVKEYTEISAEEAFKIVFLDEGDYLTAEAQAVLRRVIEKSSLTCRFIISCNFPNKIIKPIQDRCAQMRFKAIKPGDMKLFLNNVREKESINISDEALVTLAALSKGSMRKPLNVLETIKKAGIAKVEEADIYDYTYWVNYDDLKKLLIHIKDKDLKKAEVRINDMLFEKCYEIGEILEGLDTVIQDSDFDANFKLEALDSLAETDFHISTRANPYIALRGYVAHMMKTI